MGIIESIFGRKTITESGEALVKPSGKGKAYGLNAEEEDHNHSNLMKMYKKAYENVPLITAIVDVQADQAVQEFYFDGPNSKKIEDWSDNVNLMQFFHKVSKLLLIYGNAYTEIVKKGEEIVEMKIIDPITMQVYREPTGDVIGYGQFIADKPVVLWGTTGSPEEDLKFGKKVSDVEKIVHFKHNVISSEKYGLSIIKPLVPSINTKLDMEENLRKVLFKYVAPLIWAKVGSNEFPANQAVVDEISSTLKDLQAESEVTTSHLVELQILDFNAKGMDINTPINHVESQIITGGQVPPVLLGRSEGVDTASAEVQLRSFGRHIRALQRELKIEFEDKIIVRQGLGNAKDKLLWLQAEEREKEIEMDAIRGLVTDGILTPQKANSLLPPKFHETLPEIDPLNQQNVGPGGVQVPRANQMKNDKVKDNPNNPTQTTKNDASFGKRVKKTDRTVPMDEEGDE